MMGGVVWVTGLPGAGKSTLTLRLAKSFKADLIHSIVLDGDSLRSVLDDNDYSVAGRRKLAFTYAKLGKLIADSGAVVLLATVSMFEDIRQWNRQNIVNYCEVYLKVSDQGLVLRNQKGLYSNGKPIQFGTDYQEPAEPDIILEDAGYSEFDTASLQIKQIVDKWQYED